MPLQQKRIRHPIVRMETVTAGLCLLLLWSSGLYAQEADPFGSAGDDSLLFGSEFDLGGDDFSFEADDEAGGAETETGEEDFFGDFGEEDTEEPAEAEINSSEGDEWGLDNSADYESLITRTTEGGDPFLEEQPDHPLELGKYVKGTFLEDTGFTLSLYSPQVVPDALSTWFSFMDFSLTTELPWHFSFDPVDLSFAVDISTFKFVNSFPVGGDFKGFSVIPLARAEAFGVELELGMGMYIPTFGAMAGIGYAYQFHSLFFSGGYRWNWAYNIDPIGSAWWLEPRFTAGIKFW